MVFLKYKVFCNTDQKWEYVIKQDDESPPAFCPVNSDHEILLESVAIDESFDVSGNFVEVVKLPESQPFSAPTFRTKRDSSETILEMIESETKEIILEINEERFIHGGEIVFVGSKIGDYFEAEVCDPNGVIPEDIRSTICENWPIVTKYVNRQWLPDGSGLLQVVTKPLNAKIPQGLFLKILFKTCQKLGQREFGVNYYLTKKLF
jgi:hypothetical protein